jgi:hypothetical protein
VQKLRLLDEQSDALREGERPSRVDASRDDGELLTTVTCEDVFDTQRAANDRG